MPGIKRSRSHADDFADLEDHLPVDFDPEDDATNFNSEEEQYSDSDASAIKDANAGRDHYEKVGKGSLRQLEPAALGPQYSGSKISRKRAAEEEAAHDPFNDEYGSDESESGVSEDSEDEGLDDDSEDVEDNDDDELDDSELEDGDDPNARPANTATVDRTELRKIIERENKAVAAGLSVANQADAEKGRAVKRQRRTYDALLNTRIRLQQGLISANTLQTLVATPNIANGDSERYEHTEVEREAYEAAEEAALTLWNTIEHLRRAIAGDKSSIASSPATQSTSTDIMWQRMTTLETKAKAYRTSTLSKWSKKTANLTQQTTVATQHRLNPAANAQPATIVEILNTQHLSTSNVDRLVQRTKVPRSCAPVQAAAGVPEAATIFDDADFYGLLLKELLDSRNVDTSSTAIADASTLDAEQAYRLAQKSAKVKKNVDTKASKGRKLRYTVHERLQNFMAPENRTAWAERQIDELFGSLLGQRSGIVGAAQEVEDNEDLVIEDALRLFRN